MSYRINVPEGTANTMKLTILGATGATGTTLTGQALAAGHEVTAVVRDPARLAVPAHPRLRTVTADIMDPASIAPAIDGADAVLSAVGPRGTGPTTGGCQDVLHRHLVERCDQTMRGNVHGKCSGTALS